MLLLGCMTTYGRSINKNSLKSSAVTRQIGDVKVSIQFYSPSIVRIVKYPASDACPQKKSYSVIMKREAVRVTGNESNGCLTLASSQMRVALDLKTGRVNYSTAEGKPLMQESRFTFERRQGDKDAGKYKVSQTWQIAKDENIFGLGQLRDTLMVQRNRHADIWNGNTYTSIPYITSERGWGLYWDNSGRSYYEDNAQGTTFTSEVGQIGRAHV